MIKLQVIYQLFLAIFLGGLIGIERKSKEREAGLQTYSLISLGACSFTLLSSEIIFFFQKTISVAFDPIRVIQAIITGIGFVGAGVIFKQPSRVVGITTASGLWVAGAIGVAIGIGQYSLAIFITFFTLLILVALGWLEEKIFKRD